MKQYVIKDVKDFILDDIFDCGQCFRWNKESDNSYTGVVKCKVVNISMQDKDVIIDNADENDFSEIWKEYFDLNTDYGKIKKELSKNDDMIKIAIKDGEGIRILNQEVWETIASFIISANNNIPRIKGCIENLCEQFGENIGEYKGKIRYSFPTAERIANLTVEELKDCRLGYRDKYLIESAKTFCELGKEHFESLKSENISYKDAMKEIKKLKGVGPKVANCILLFSMKKRDAFPIDVWMKKVMNELYGIDENDVKAMECLANEKFGKNAGIAQQYLFYHMRGK